MHVHKISQGFYKNNGNKCTMHACKVSMVQRHARSKNSEKVNVIELKGTHVRALELSNACHEA